MKHLGHKIGMGFDNVGGLDRQLNDIARRVLASRANPAAARKLGIGHVRGVLLSGPPGSSSFAFRAGRPCARAAGEVIPLEPFQLTDRTSLSTLCPISLASCSGCGKTLLARELARLLGAREPQIVNGPEVRTFYPRSSAGGRSLCPVYDSSCIAASELTHSYYDKC